MKAEKKSAFSFLSRLFWFVLAMAVLIAVLHTVLARAEAGTTSPVSAAELAPQVILDPGHGGADPGAVSASGAVEKDLNLKVALVLGAFLEEAGVRVAYTRTGDEMLDHPGTGTRKQGDLMGRVALGRQYPDAIFVSIHMNTLPQAQYSGLQVFYGSGNTNGRVLAQTLQNLIRELLQPENKREVKEAGSSIFVLDRLEGTAVLVECGFLSNREEAALLADEAYRNKLSFVLSRGILEVLNSRSQKS